MFILVGGHQQWWVWGWMYHAKAEEAEEWKALALKAPELVDRSLAVVERERALR